MGYHNADQVSRNWRHLDGNPFKILIRMALHINDDDPNPTWWGGIDILGYTIGRSDPPMSDQSEDAQRYREQSAQSVKRAIAVLVRAGALSVSQRPCRGRRAEYSVHFGGLGGLSEAPNVPVDISIGGLSGAPNARGADGNGGPSGPSMGAPESRNGGPSGAGMGARQGPPKQTLATRDQYLDQPTSPKSGTSPSMITTDERDECCDELGWVNDPTGSKKCPLHFRARNAS